jgi:cellulose synthase (UDP-forming)
VLAVRAWGARRLSRTALGRGDLLARWTVQVCAGVSCARWLLTRKAPGTGVGTAVRTVAVVETVLVGVLGYAVAGLAGAVPWHTSASSTVASGAWLLVAVVALGLGALRLRSADLATAQTDTHRFRIHGRATVDGFDARLVDVAVDGVTVGLPLHDWPGSATVELALPGAETVTLALLPEAGGARPRSLRTLPGDWQALRTLSLWLVHTYPGNTQLKTVMHP